MSFCVECQTEIQFFNFFCGWFVMVRVDSLLFANVSGLLGLLPKNSHDMPVGSGSLDLRA